MNDYSSDFYGLVIACLILVALSVQCPSNLFGQDSPAALSGFEPNEIFDVRDGGKVGHSNEILSRLLHRCFQVSEKSLRRASRQTKDVAIAEINDSPRDYRFYPFAINGIANGFTTHLIENDANAYSGVDLLHVTDASGQECLVALPIVSDSQMQSALPHQWLANKKIQQPIEFVGFFMGLRNFETEPADNAASIAAPDSLNNKLNPPLFVARRINWYPERISETFEITATDLLLAQAGVDFNQLRQLGGRTGFGVAADEATSFYQLLKATSELDAQAIPTPKIELETMLRDPAQCLARPVAITGHIRRVTEIAVEDADIRQPLGIDKYYQLDMFLPLDNRRIVIKPPSKKSGEKKRPGGESQDLVFKNRFPVTVCTCSLPLEKSQINQNRVTVRGFFFKNWSYESELSLENQSGARQIAPLIIAMQPEIVPLGPNYFGWVLMSFAIAVLGAAVLLAWLMRSRPVPGNQHAMPDRIEVPDID